MKQLFLSLAAVLGLLATLTAAPAAACTGQEACPLGDRSYHLREPDNWDGVSPLPVLLHFHGWGRQGSLIVRHDRIATLEVADNVLLLAPNGLGGSWDFRRSASRDSAFARAVIDDAASRYPIDPDQIFISGYSYGSFMAWRFVCDDGNDIAALLAVSGSFPENAECAQAPREARQVYGLNDGVLRFPFGAAGDTTTPVAIWRDRFDCGAPGDEYQWNARDFLTFERTVWDCAGGKVVLDLHPGGHFIPHDWIPRQIEQIRNGTD